MADELDPNSGEVHGGSASDPQALREELKQCQALRDEYLAGWKRARADYANLEKEEKKRFEEFSKFATQSFLVEFISILDSFDLAFKELSKKGSLEKGLELLRQQCGEFAKRKGLLGLETKIGEKFDPLHHESVAEIESDKQPGTIVEIVKKGYTLHGKVMRPAQVILAKEK